MLRSSLGGEFGPCRNYTRCNLVCSGTPFPSFCAAISRLITEVCVCVGGGGGGGGFVCSTF